MTNLTVVDNIYRPQIKTNYAIHLYACSVSAGFPSPAEEYLEGKLDLNQHLIPHPLATFFVRVAGDSMIGAGIHEGDLLIVDRSLEARDGKVVIAVVNGELLVILRTAITCVFETLILTRFSIFMRSLIMK